MEIVIVMIIIVGLIALAVWVAAANEKNKNTLQKNIERLRDFNATKSLLDDGITIENNLKLKGILIDEKRHKIALVNHIDDIKIYGYKDILEVELIEDGASLMKSSSGSMIGRGIVGGAVSYTHLTLPTKRIV